MKTLTETPPSLTWYDLLHEKLSEHSAIRDLIEQYIPKDLQISVAENAESELSGSYILHLPEAVLDELKDATESFQSDGTTIFETSENGVLSVTFYMVPLSNNPYARVVITFAPQSQAVTVQELIALLDTQKSESPTFCTLGVEERTLYLGLSDTSSTRIKQALGISDENNRDIEVDEDRTVVEFSLPSELNRKQIKQLLRYRQTIHTQLRLQRNEIKDLGYYQYEYEGAMQRRIAFLVSTDTSVGQTLLQNCHDQLLQKVSETTD